MKVEEISSLVKSWLIEAGTRVQNSIHHPLVIETKTSRTDLVTNVDRKVEQFLVEKIKAYFPSDQVIGEEGFGDNVMSAKGNIWVIDPIDGTLNFVKQQENFCIMLAYYQDGVGKLGFIYDVMKNSLYWGGAEIGVFCNDQALPKIKNQSLEDGLVGMNSYMFQTNQQNGQEIIRQSSGVRMLGCAGIEFIQILLGKQVAYLSSIAPWDYAAGSVLVCTLGGIVSNLDGTPLNILNTKRVPVVCATKRAHEQIIEYANKV
ncbi:inositol monophosphatase family protein [Vagococcus entomophilus]|uniref:inositol-phosphate phosphatase n=1 Tax=Vagococcus entomophilus TaxID=1160095 RepID=A0A430AEV0_9ENTE|nr:inositol monophosphatase family protein [Vagococcus entomophilus]RSU05958.1 hypothetical protein CBF30_11650 [Vagococcus entomophilus]